MQVLTVAQRRWGADQVAYIEVTNRQDGNARIEVSRLDDSVLQVAEKTLLFDGTNGELLNVYKSDAGPGLHFYDVLVGLHEGLFAGPRMRWLYFLSGLLGAAVIATGCLFWQRRHQLRAKAQVTSGMRIVQALNVATLVGLPVAIGVYFLANRWLPLELVDRENWEMHCLFISWLLLFVHSGLRAGNSAWFEQLLAAVIVFVAVPLSSGVLTERHLLVAVSRGDWILAGIDSFFLLLALLAGLAAWRLRPILISKRW